MNFEKLNIITPILKALTAQGYTRPTPIQAMAIPIILEGKDILACAQTGTGKTAAFAAPILQMLHKANPVDTINFIGTKSGSDMDTDAAADVTAEANTGMNINGNCKTNSNDLNKNVKLRNIKALVLTPTRELAVQIYESFHAYGRNTRLKQTVVYGGVSQIHQTKALQSGVDILVATPGRLLDLIDQKYIDLSHVGIFVLDEADRMLDMGFSHDVKKIIALLPVKRQTLMFSATMPPEITVLVSTILTDPVRIEAEPVSSTVDTIEQTVYFVSREEKMSLLIQLLSGNKVDSALVFARTKHGADKIVKDLAKANILAQAIHGNKSQMARQTALDNFKQKRTRVLVATDIAARGIDVRELSHVINFDMPAIPETYVHRIGRTGRAGIAGTALSFCDRDEKKYLMDIQKLISKKIPVFMKPGGTFTAESAV